MIQISKIFLLKQLEGRKIRKAFIASPNHFIFSVDYSQVELRILAHVANVDSLLNAFQKMKIFIVLQQWMFFRLIKHHLIQI